MAPGLLDAPSPLGTTLPPVAVGEFFLGGGCRPSSKMSNIFGCTCPNHSGVGAIDNLDRFEQVFDTYYIPEASKKIFMDDISMVRP